MTTATPPDPAALAPPHFTRPRRGRDGFRLFRKIFLYHLALVVLVVAAAMLFPRFTSSLPIGGVTELMEGGELTVSRLEDVPMPAEDIEIVTTMIRATSELDRLGYARELLIVLVGVWLLMLPVSWVHKGIHRVSAHDHSLDETTLILPGVVAAIVLVVQHSLALAFSLAGIVAGVQFRRALQDTFDALFILVAIGTGIAAVLTVFFSYATLYVYFFGDGLESDHLALRKAEKRQQKLAEQAVPPADAPVAAPPPHKDDA